MLLDALYPDVIACGAGQCASCCAVMGKIHLGYHRQTVKKACMLIHSRLNMLQSGRSARCVLAERMFTAAQEIHGLQLLALLLPCEGSLLDYAISR